MMVHGKLRLAVGDDETIMGHTTSSSFLPGATQQKRWKIQVIDILVHHEKISCPVQHRRI